MIRNIHHETEYSTCKRFSAKRLLIPVYSFFFCPTEKIPSAPEIARNCDRQMKMREDAQKPNGCNYDSI